MEKETKQQQLINKIVANDSVTSPFSGKDFFNCLLNVTHENKSRNDITTELNHREMQKIGGSLEPRNFAKAKTSFLKV